MSLDPIQTRIDLAIGETCYWWSALEHLVHDICLHLAACLSVDFERSQTSIPLHIALSNMEMRQRIATAKAFASQAPTASKTFYQRLEAELNRIDNEHRTERNRYVHDLWLVGEDRKSVERLQSRTIVNRPQSRKLELQIGTTKSFASIEQVEAFVDALQKSYQTLADLDGETAAMASELARLEELQKSIGRGS